MYIIINIFMVLILIRVLDENWPVQLELCGKDG